MFRKKKITHKIIDFFRYRYARFIIFFQILIRKIKRQRIILKLEKGDIILASPRFARLSFIAFFHRVMLGARYVHSMLYIGNGKVIHTTTRYGVVIGRVPGKISSSERYAIFRVKNLTPEQKEQIAKEALKWHKKKLDATGLVRVIPQRLINLPTRSAQKKQSVWCSKLIYQVYLSQGIELVPRDQADIIISEDLSKNPLLQRIN
jgi:hypothetical protein